jgi:hypothetical protein
VYRLLNTLTAERKRGLSFTRSEKPDRPKKKPSAPGKEGQAITWAEERAPRWFGNANSFGGSRTPCVAASPRRAESSIFGNSKRTPDIGETVGSRRRCTDHCQRPPYRPQAQQILGPLGASHSAASLSAGAGGDRVFVITVANCPEDQRSP